MAEVLHVQAQVRTHGGGRSEAVPRAHLLRKRAARKLHHGGDARAARGAQARHGIQLPVGRGEHARDAAEAGEEIAPQIDGAAAADARAEEKREKLRVGKRRGAMGDEAFARPLHERRTWHRHATLGE